MKKTNFHTHTYRCGHANGSEEDMICAAMKMGIEELGLSEHVPLPHYRQHLFKSLVAIRSPRSFLSLIYAFIKNGPSMRMPYKDLDQYLEAINDCQKKYQSQIKLYKGFEAEGFLKYKISFENEKFNKLIRCVENLNVEISKDESLGNGFCIGHSYFCGLDITDEQTLSGIIEYELIPLLKEYWFDEQEKVENWSNRLRSTIK